MKNQALELHSPLPKSFKVCKERTRKNRVKKTEDSSCSLLAHFWSTSRSPFSTLYIPFESSESQESNASNRVRFGAEMRKLQPLEDDCSKLKEGFSKVLRNQLARFSQVTMQRAKSTCELGYLCTDSFRTFLQIFLYKFPFSPCIQPLM